MAQKRYRLVGPDGRERQSLAPGTLGGHRKNRIYGRLDCPGALRWIERGHYVKQRVFFADEVTAIAAGYRPCARCMPTEYAAWKATGARFGRAGDDVPPHRKRRSAHEVTSDF